MTAPLPEKLKKDSIVEAVLEIQFRSSEVPELVVGKLVTAKTWAGRETVSLPASAIPPPVRRLEAGMAHLAVIELRKSAECFARVGEQVISTHRQAPYPSWGTFGGEAHETIEGLLSAGIQDLSVTRLGLRYINAFTPEDHGINSLNDLHLNIQIGEGRLGDPFTLTFRRQVDGVGSAMVRMASKEMVLNPVPSNLTLLLDIDIATPPDFVSSDVGQMHAWLEAAHLAEKGEYMAVFTQEMYDRLVEK